jgi:O-antigen ligase
VEIADQLGTVRRSPAPRGAAPTGLGGREVAQADAAPGGINTFLWGALIISFPFTALDFWHHTMPTTLSEPAFYLTTLLMLLTIAEDLARQKKLFFPKGRSFLILLAFIAYAGLPIFLVPHLRYSWWPGLNPVTKSYTAWLQLAIAASVTYLTLRFVQSWEDFRFALKCSFVGFLLALGAGGLQIAGAFWPRGLAADLFLLLHGLSAQFSGRLDLLGQEPAMGGDYLLAILPFLVLGSFYWKSLWWTFLWSAVGIALLCGTLSFGSYAALLGSALVTGLVISQRGSRCFLVPVLLLVLAMGAVGTSTRDSLYWSVRDRAWDILDNGLGPDLQSWSTRSRFAGAETTFNIFLDHPLMGVGLGMPRFYVYEYMPSWAMSDAVLRRSVMGNNPAGVSSNNLFIELLASTGLPGFLLFVSFLLSMLAGSYQAVRCAKEKWKRNALAGIFFALVAQIFHYFALNDFAFRYWFFIWGLAICSRQLVMQDDRRMARRTSSFVYQPFAPRDLSRS